MLAQRMREGLDATAVHHETGYAKREILIDFRERREMVEMILRLKGLLNDRKVDDRGPTLEELLESSKED